MDVNKVSLIGNLVADPSLTTTRSGRAVARVKVATNYLWRDAKTGEKRESAEFHRVAFTGQLATIAGEYLKKGSKVYIEGRLTSRPRRSSSGDDQVAYVAADELIMLGHRTRR